MNEVCAPNGWLMTAFCLLIFAAGVGAGILAALSSRFMRPPPDPGPPPEYPHVDERGRVSWTTRQLLDRSPQQQADQVSEK